MDKLTKIADDALENVSGGNNRIYSVAEYGDAGVSITQSGGKTIYSVTRSNGTNQVITSNAAMSMVESYKLSNQRLSEKELDDLIAQCC